MMKIMESPMPTQEMPEKEAPPAPEPEIQAANSFSSKLNWFLIGGGVVLVILVGVIGFLFYQNQQLKKQVAKKPLSTVIPTTGPSPIPTSKIEPSPTDLEWQVYTSERVVDYYQPFKLYYPSSWKIKIDKRTEPPASLDFWLEKNGFKIRIMQAPGGGASCLYPEDPMIEGMFVKYGEYKEFIKNGIIWRRAMSETQTDDVMGYNVCEKRQDDKYFKGTTSIGLFSLRGSHFDSQVLEEFDEILERVEILEEEADLYSCNLDSDCGVNICDCRAQRKETIKDEDKICARHCPGEPQCINNRCVLVD